jgi:hypothetical protein
MNSGLTWENVVPERGVEPLCPFGQTGLSRPRIPFRHPGRGHDQHGRRPARARIILPQLSHGQSIRYALLTTSIWLECPRDWR